MGATDGNGDAKQRMEWLWANFVGHTVVVELTDGTHVEGLYLGKNPDQFSINLAYTRRKAFGKLKPKDKIKMHETETIEAAQIRSVSAVDILLAGGSPKPVNTKHATDASNNRELEKMSWDIEELPAGSGDMQFDDSTYEAGSFDQFKANEKLYGVRSTYSFDQYSTVLDKSQLTEEQRQQAIKIAHDIEKGTKGGHGGEYDSTVGIWAADYDEEALHAAVNSGSKYVPPSMRDGEPPAKVF